SVIERANGHGISRKKFRGFRGQVLAMTKLAELIIRRVSFFGDQNIPFGIPSRPHFEPLGLHCVILEIGDREKSAGRRKVKKGKETDALQDQPGQKKEDENG